MPIKPFHRGLLAALGVLLVGLATIGIFVPLLPTTPFLLLAAACFIRSSDRLYHWLVSHRWFGRYIRNYREHRAITRSTKIVTLLLLWGTLGFAAIWVVSGILVRVLLLVVGAGVTIHMLRMKTLTRETYGEESETPFESEQRPREVRHSLERGEENARTVDQMRVGE